MDGDECCEHKVYEAEYQIQCEPEVPFTFSSGVDEKNNLSARNRMTFLISRRPQTRTKKLKLLVVFF